MKNRYVLAAAIFASLGLCNATVGQQLQTAAVGGTLYLIPGIFYPQAMALGSRLTMKGKERTIYAGQFFDASGKPSPARVIYQLPNLVRLEGFKAGEATLSFNGTRAAGITSSREDESLLEAFVMDYPEGLLQSVQGAAAVRLLGRGFGPDPAKEPNYTGPRYDIYEVTASIASQQDKAVRSKTYYFDTKTGLLQSARYYDRTVTPPARIETRFSMWGTVNGSAYPAQVDHYEGGKLVFSFIATGIENGPALDLGNF